MVIKQQKLDYSNLRVERNAMLALGSSRDFCEIEDRDGAGANHFSNSEFPIVRLEVNGANRVSQEQNFEALLQTVQHRVLDAIISGQAADDYPLDSLSLIHI